MVLVILILYRSFKLNKDKKKKKFKILIFWKLAFKLKKLCLKKRFK